MLSAELLGAGSILDAWARATTRSRLKTRMIARRSSDLHVWGTGTMGPGGLNWPQRLHVHAVRGRLTAQQLGVEATFGDPGILASLLVGKPVQQQWRIGLVPHFVDTASVIRRIRIPAHHKIVNPESSVDDVLAQISACELIASSSLHGLIVADSYNIPCIWLSSLAPLAGRKDWKFRDYETSRGASFNEPLTYEKFVTLDSNEVFALATKAAREIETWQQELLSVFPFR